MFFSPLIRILHRSGSPRQSGRNARRKSRCAQPARFVPRLETLESRAVPSVSYNFQTIDEPAAGQEFFQGSSASGINSSGQIVGTYTDANQVLHGYLLNGGQYTTLDDPNATGGTTASGINDPGQIVGSYIAGFGLHGFVFENGQYTTIDAPNSLPATTQADGINNSGTIVGAYLDSNLVVRGYMLSHGQFTILNDPDAGTSFVQGTYARGINDRGQIVGTYVDANYQFHAFVLSGGKYTTIDPPGAAPDFFQGSTASGINDRGQIVGGYTDANFVDHGFVLNGDQYTVLDDPSAATTGFMPGTDASGINDRGQIVGRYSDSNMVEHGFLASPVLGEGSAKPDAGPAGSGSPGQESVGTSAPPGADSSGNNSGRSLHDLLSAAIGGPSPGKGKHGFPAGSDVFMDYLDSMGGQALA